MPDLGVFKIEAEDPVPGLDNLVAILEERRSTYFDISKSIVEVFVEEIN